MIVLFRGAIQATPFFCSATFHRLCLTAILFFLQGNAQAETLERLIDDAISSHPLVQSQLSQRKAAQVGVESARWQFFPTPSIAVERALASNNDLSYQGDDYVATASLTQPLWTGGRLSAGMDRAEANVNASEAGLQESQQDIALRVVQNYGEWLAAFLKRNTWEKSLETHLRLRDQVKRRVEEGVSVQSDLSLAEGRLESTRAEAAAVRAQEAVALSGLIQLVGRNLEAEELAKTPAEPSLQLHSLKELESQALKLSPGVKRAQAQIATVDAEINERKADLLPEVSLRFERQHGNFNVDNADDENRIFINFNSRFGAGLSSFSNVREARMRREGALANVAAQRRVVSEQVIADFSLASSFGLRVQALQSSLKTAHSVSESYGRQFLAGRKTWLDVMNAARDLVSTEVQLADAQASQLTVTWRLAILTQGVEQVITRPRF